MKAGSLCFKIPIKKFIFRQEFPHLHFKSYICLNKIKNKQQLMQHYTGQYILNPARAELMYFPVKFGRTTLRHVEIK